MTLAVMFLFITQLLTAQVLVSAKNFTKEVRLALGSELMPLALPEPHVYTKRLAWNRCDSLLLSKKRFVQEETLCVELLTNG